MKIYKQQNVFDAALDRMRYLFDEFENVIVSFSGGKDSTVILNLALKIAEEKNRLPLKVLFLDQEAEWTAVIDYIRTVMYDPRVEPWWMQIPLRLYNSTSTTDNWLNCWDEQAKDKWVHPQDPISKKLNLYGSDRFKALFTKIIGVEFKDQKTCYLAGVRTEESHNREMALTQQLTYKAITYGTLLNKKLQHYTFYPIYDWCVQDVWKAIHDNHWPYCSIYDSYYSYGVSIREMRVSNVHHETAVKNLFLLQEMDAEVWERLTQRISGINTAGQLKKDSISTPTQLPPMFSDWIEFRDYLLENLCTEETIKKRFQAIFKKGDAIYQHNLIKRCWAIGGISAILVNDTGAKIQNWQTRPKVNGYRRFMEGKSHLANNHNEFIQDAINGGHDVWNPKKKLSTSAR